MEALFSFSYNDFANRTQIANPDAAFDNSFSDNIAGLITALNEYIKASQISSTSVLSFVKKLFSEETILENSLKISFASKFIQFLSGNFLIQITPAEITTAQKDSTLQNILQKYIDKGIIPPQLWNIFQIDTKPHIQHAMRRP